MCLVVPWGRAYFCSTGNIELVVGPWLPIRSEIYLNKCEIVRPDQVKSERIFYRTRVRSCFRKVNAKTGSTFSTMSLRLEKIVICFSIEHYVLFTVTLFTRLCHCLRFQHDLSVLKGWQCRMLTRKLRMQQSNRTGMCKTRRSFICLKRWKKGQKKRI